MTLARPRSPDPYSLLRVRLAWRAQERAKRQAGAVPLAAHGFAMARKRAAAAAVDAAMRDAHDRGATVRQLAAATGMSHGGAHHRIGSARVRQRVQPPCGCRAGQHDCEDWPIPAWARRYLARFDPRTA